MSSLHVTPCFSTDYLSDSRSMDTERGSNLFVTIPSCFPHLSDFQSVGFSKFRSRMIASVKSWFLAGSPLIGHVVHVVGLSAKKQVLRITASSVVAPVQHGHSVRYWAVRNFPRYAMGAIEPSIDTDSAVARSVARTLPFVAT